MPRRSRIHLDDVPLDEAKRRFWRALDEAGWEFPLTGELVPVSEAHGRVTAAPVWAANSSPHYAACAMDGVAVRAVDTIRATESAPIRLRLSIQAAWVDTGDPLPA